MTVFTDSTPLVCFVQEYNTGLSENFVLQQDTEKKFSEYLKDFLKDTTKILRDARIQARKNYPTLFS